MKKIITLVFFGMVIGLLGTSNVLAGDVLCSYELGAVIVGDNIIVNGACTLNGTTVQGKVDVQQGGELLATGANIYGDLKADGAARIRLIGTNVGGNVTLKKTNGTGSGQIISATLGNDLELSENQTAFEIRTTTIDNNLKVNKNPGGLSIVQNQIGNDFQYNENQTGSEIRGNIIGNNLTANKNTGGLGISDNQVGGNFECKENQPLSEMRNNTVSGDLKVEKNIGGFSIEDNQVDGKLECRENQALYEIRNNTVGDNLRAEKNTGGLIISDNQIDKDLECKDNDPAPTGSDNQVGGNAKDQCAVLEPTMVPVPDVVGQVQADAESAINEVYLTVGSITTAANETVPIGHVISQDPSAGTLVEEDSAVDLVVSMGPEPTVKISAEPQTIVVGESSTLSWETTHADSCVIEPGIGPVDVNSFIVVSPSETTIYTITATGPAGTATSTVTVNVLYPPTVEISPDPETIFLGEFSTLSWNSTYADSAKIDQGIGSVPVNGSTIVLPTGTTTYTVTVTGLGGIATAATMVTILNRPPVADIQTITTDEDTPASITLSGSDPDGDALTFSVISQPLHGTLAGTAPDLTYTPDENYNGADAFSFKVNDGTVDSNPATVNITVAAVNDAPVANAQTISVNEDESKPVPLSASDVEGDSLTYEIVEEPSHGTLSGTAPVLTYTPDENYHGDDSFSFKVNDGNLDGNTAIVSLTINPANDAPVADAGSDQTVFKSDTVNLNGGGSNDVDGDGLTYQWSFSSVPAGSTAELSDPLIASPSFAPDIVGTYAVQLIVNDGTVDSAPDTVVITADMRMVAVPDVVGQIQANAEAALIGANLTVGTISAANSDTVAADHVISQNPASGTSVEEGSAVDLVVSLGPEYQTPTVSIGAYPPEIHQGESSTLSWNSTNADSAHIDNGIGAVDPNNSISVSPDHTTTYTLAVTGAGGNASATVTLEVHGDPVPQPEGSFGERYEDLVPPDATVDQYEPDRFSLITGKVQNSAGAAMANVSVTIHDHPEYGTAVTDELGEYSIPLEGGGMLNAVYRIEGFIPVHRKVYVPWNDTAIAETVVMVAEDPASTTLTFNGDPDTLVTHKSTEISDESGTRALTMVFNGDNRAYLLDEQGNDVQELDTITIRATEYTTPESMPAKLPPNSAYTYCAELSVDGADRVRFKDPVIIWVDNFLGFPVGSIVPVGFYDRDKGVWVPSQNGKVVELRDNDNDGVVDAFYDGLNINDVRGLEDSDSYPPGSTFWRVALNHFSPCDINWPFGLLPGSTGPNPNGTSHSDGQRDDGTDPQRHICSFVEEKSRTFHEDIPIHGTDLTLHYTSSRVAGYKPGVITVPASGDTVSDNLVRIVVKVKVAGREYQVDLPPAPNQTTEIEWDGLDHMGRPVIGPLVAQVEIGFVYYGVYFVPSSGGQAFGRPGTSSLTIPTRQEIILWQKSQVPIVRGMGTLAEGWSLSSHHQVSPLDPSLLFKGDGTISRNNAVVINTYAGNGSEGYSGDGGLATEAALGYELHGIDTDAAGNLYIVAGEVVSFHHWNSRIRKVGIDGIIEPVIQYLRHPHGVAVDDKGNIYIAEHSLSVVYKLDADGLKTTYAGIYNNPGYNGDGIPATQAQLNYTWGLDVDAEGNLYIADKYNHRIRKVDPSGIITTVAGNGSRGNGGDGGPATEATLTYPSEIAVDKAGNLYISAGRYVRKVDTSGIITTVAGNGDWLTSGDGGPATEAGLTSVESLEVDAAGNLYIVSSYAHRVRKVDTNGIITTVAGTGPIGYQEGDFSGDGGAATGARMNRPDDVAVDPAGNVFVADDGNRRIRIVSPPAARLQRVMGTSDIVFAEETDIGYIMSPAGLHKKTIDLATGVTLNEFGYDGDSNLISITDQFGNQIVIERDGGDVPTAIISPDGIRTELTIDADNHLTRITNPDGSYYDFEYTTDGLLRLKTQPAGNQFGHIFDVNGRITDFTDDEGGHWQFSNSMLENGDVLHETLTGESNLTSYMDSSSSSGAFTSTITDPNGAQTQFTSSDDGLTDETSFSCGEQLEKKYNLDSEYKFKYIEELKEILPSGLQRITLNSRVYQDDNSDGIPDRITDTITVNGRATTLEQNISQATKTATSPEGRAVSAIYDPETLAIRNVSISGLYDTVFTYDLKGRIASQTTNTRQTTLSYVDDANGHQISITDPEQQQWIYNIDPMDRLSSIQGPDGGQVQLVYDKNGNMTVLTNPVDVAHGFGFNNVNLNNSYQTPLSGSYSYVYDTDRRLIQTNFPSGNTIIKDYADPTDPNDKSRLWQIRSPEGNVEFTYLCGTKIDSITKGMESITYGYDGKLFTSETLAGTLNQSLTYTYNNDFDVSSFAYAGATVNYSYDNDRLLTEAGSFTIARNTDNGLPESVAGGGLNLTRTFNGFGEVDSQDISVSSQNVASWSLTRDNIGRITNKTQTVDGVTSDYVYSYDSMGRLLTVTKDSTLVEEYQYDLNGTRIYEMNSLRGIAGRTYSYSDEDHLLSAGSVTYSYDLDGFLTTKTDGSNVTNYSYSSRGELLTVNLPDGRFVEYIQDPLGRRIAKKVNGVIVEKYLWQGLTRLLAVYDGSDNLVMRFEYADDRLPVAMTSGGSTYYLTYDQVGSLQIVADGAGNVVKRIDYDSFGYIIADSDPALEVLFGFAGGLHDRDTGLVRFGYRDYDPDIGRWTAKDPIGFAGGDTDLYGYVLYDPINRIDPEGLASNPCRKNETTLFESDSFFYNAGSGILMQAIGPPPPIGPMDIWTPAEMIAKHPKEFRQGLEAYRESTERVNDMIEALEKGRLGPLKKWNK